MNSPILDAIKDGKKVTKIVMGNGNTSLIIPYKDPIEIFRDNCVFVGDNGSLLRTLEPKDKHVSKTTRKSVKMIASYTLLKEAKYLPLNNVVSMSVIENPEALEDLKTDLEGMYKDIENDEKKETE